MDKVVFALVFGAICLLTSCVETVEVQQKVYSNKFSDVDLRNFENGRLFVWVRDTIAGFYHNEEVAVTIPDLPTHNYLKITIELLIHDTWDGNVPDGGISGPDEWYLGADEVEFFRTTFSNSPCVATYCLRQSYPGNYFRQNFPKTGAIQTNLPGLCLFGPVPNYTTRYRISQVIEHVNPSVRVFMGDNLKQTNSPWPACDESWSIAAIEVETILTNR